MIMTATTMALKTAYDQLEKIVGIAAGSAGGILAYSQYTEQLITVGMAVVIALLTGFAGALGAHFAKKVINKFKW
jgi:hypothetical protein